jgi:hypothetical protein
LFVEILFCIQRITFHCIRILHQQKRRTLPHNFSLQRPATFAMRLALANGHFRQTHEKLYGRNDTAPEALEARYAKRIASETIAFAFPRPVDSEDQTAIY